MKLTAFALTASLVAVSGLAAAKVDYVTGVVTNVDAENKQISITEGKSGKSKTYRYHEKARIKTASGAKKKVSSLRDGDDVTLKLKTLKLEK